MVSDVIIRLDAPSITSSGCEAGMAAEIRGGYEGLSLYSHIWVGGRMAAHGGEASDTVLKETAALSGKHNECQGSTGPA